jgi:rhodanese-related sulfurtransferase
VIRTPVRQAVLLVLLATVLGLGSNWVRSDTIPLLAEEPETVESMDELLAEVTEPRIRAINLEQAKALYDQGVVFVDARDVEYYQTGHIRGAYPNTNFLELAFTLDSLQGKTAPIVTYCDGSECGSSEDLAYDLQGAGFMNILVFYGGWEEWKTANYPVEE